MKLQKRQYHTCCNQLEHRWEVRDKEENIIFYGSLEEVDKKLEELEG